MAAPAQTAGDFADTAPLASLPDLDLTANDAQPANGSPAAEEQRRERRSRDRYGRDRRERGDRGPRDSAGTEAAAPAPAMLDFDLNQASPAAVQDAEPARRSYFTAPAADIQPAEAAATAVLSAEPAAPAVPAAAAPAAVAEAVAPAAIAPAPAPVARAAAPAAPAQSPAPAPAAATGLPRVQPFTLPVGELQQVAAASGLQWVNSDADKVAAVRAAIAAEPQPIRVPRERPPAVVLDEGPLVLVETRRDLSAMALPFEQTPAA